MTQTNDYNWRTSFKHLKLCGSCRRRALEQPQRSVSLRIIREDHQGELPDEVVLWLVTQRLKGPEND